MDESQQKCVESDGEGEVIIEGKAPDNTKGLLEQGAEEVVDDNSNDNYDDDDSSLGIPIFENLDQVPPNKMKAEAPSEGMTWNDDAIMECFRLAVSSHGEADPANKKFQWIAEANDSMEASYSADISWKPKSLSIPLWAVDPFSNHSATPEPKVGEA